MNPMEEAKRNFENIPLPEELNSRVRAGIAQGKRKNRQHEYLRMLGTAAACLAVMAAVLNTSPTLAAAAADMPVVGGLFRLMTVRSTQTSDGDQTVTVLQPGLRGDGPLAEQVNAEIQKRVEEKTQEGMQLVQEYRDAFFATGGTEAEWAQHDNQVTVTYEVKSQTETTVSFVIHSSVSIANAYQEDFYYNLDLANGQEQTLESLLGSDWVQICNDAIQAQMAEDPDLYFSPDEGGFTTVDESTDFYVDEDGNVVVVFPQYSVAPGYLGNVEFVIKM